MARHPPAGLVAGSLELALVPFLQIHGIPVSFIAGVSDVDVTVEIGVATTVGDVLREIERQAPAYQCRTIAGRIVIYPREEAYDALVDLGPVQESTRAAAYFSVLRALREQTIVRKITALRGLDLILRGTSSRSSPWGDEIEVGGKRTVVEHLVSLIDMRPAGAFWLVASGGRSYFSIKWISLVEGINAEGPAAVKIGDSFVLSIAGTLVDGTVVLLAGRQCGVTYSASRSGVIDIDEDGRAVARSGGVGDLFAHYENHLASVEVHVE